MDPSSKEAQAANPQMAVPVVVPTTHTADYKLPHHTLDESNIDKYPEQVKAQLVAALQLAEKRNALRIGIALFDTHLTDKQIRAIPSVITKCKLVALTLLHTETDDDSDPKQAARTWLEDHGSGYPILADFFNESSSTHKQSLGSQVDIYLGQSGYDEMLHSDTVDAVYVLCPTESQPDIVLRALRASKHVLVHDHQSTTLRDFQDQMEAAQSANRFIQFSTMFAHLYSVQTFLDSVAYKLGAENMKHMHLFLRVHPRDWAQMGVVLSPDSPNYELTQTHDNCIRRLARYGVLTALLLLQQKAQYKPTSVQITKCELNSHGIVVQAAGEVWFTENSKLSFDVGYCGTAGNTACTPTRQVLEVHTDDRYATINDICVPLRDSGIATYRIYGKTVESQDKFWGPHQHRPYTITLGTDSPATNAAWDLLVTGGDSLDVVSGPPMHVITWRRFAEICRAVEQTSTTTTTGSSDGEDDDKETKRLREQAAVFQRQSIQLKSILNCLEESQRRGNIRISLPPIEAIMHRSVASTKNSPA